MRFIVRFTAFVVLVALTLASAPRSSDARRDATPTAQNCYFVRNHLPCPCPSGRQARALVRAAGMTAGALGSAIGTTATALARADQNPSAPAGPRKPSQPTRPTTR